jgi:Rrf2 family transcriptional regulator, nitric oxide-sensitive transcriptional repressor
MLLFFQNKSNTLNTSLRAFMRLAEYTDYTLRVLMYCAERPQQLVTIGELADHHRVSKNHLMKIVNDLARQGVLETTRGRGGGLRLMKKADQIRVGDVVRASETDFRLVECFDPATSQCTLSPSCRLKGLFNGALKAYFKELDGMTLAELTAPPSETGPSPASGALVRVSAPVSRRQAPGTPKAAQQRR